MFIGEAPGATEDLTGRPFVGRSGRLLRKTMEKVGIDPSSVWIDNITHCRPPGNRTPTKEEVEACKPILLNKIEKINPDLIVFVGMTSYKGLTGNTINIEREGGRIYYWRGRKCIVIYHPGWVLRDMGSRKSILERQLKEVVKVIGSRDPGLYKWS
jgi:DNA polymerase